MKMILFTQLLIILLFVGVPHEVSAQLVSCTDAATCDFCALVTTVNNVIEFIVGVLVLVVILLMAVAGMKLVISRGQGDATGEAKKFFIQVVIGFIIILASWTIVDTGLKLLTGSDLGVWNPHDCGGINEPTHGLDSYDVKNIIQVYNTTTENENARGGVVSGGKSITPDLNNLTSLRAVGVNVANWNGTNGPGRTDTADPAVVAAVLQMQQLGQRQTGAVPFQVTAAYTNGVGHSAGSQHYRGTAVDLQPINGTSYGEIIEWCKQVGFTFVNDERNANHIHCDMR